MIEIPLYFFLVAYGIFLLIFFAFAAINLYHVYTTGTFTGAMLLISTFLAVMTAVTLIVTGFFIAQTDWSEIFVIGKRYAFE